jgi:tRNA nucleotidyltransferase/poly(A) polymerase
LSRQVRKDLIELIPSNHQKNLKYIADVLVKNGHSVYLVGGAVRDLVMNIVPEEYDLTTSAIPSIVKKLFKTVIETGIQHGTVTIVLDRINYEITTFRAEKEYHDGRRPESVEYHENLSLDLKRRDFTMNALAYDIHELELIDENGGLFDIERKWIQTIGSPIERFSEDGLRPIRAIRFACNLGFTIDPNTQQAIVKTIPIIQKVSHERFNAELEKILSSPNPMKGFELLSELEIWNLFITNKIIIHDQIMPFENSNNLPLPFKYSVLLWNLWKDSLDSKKIQTIARDLKLSNKTKNEMELYYFVIRILKNSKDIEDRDLIAEILSPLAIYCKQTNQVLMNFYQPIKLGVLEPESIHKRAQVIMDSNIPLQISDLEVSGSDIINEFPHIIPKKIGTILSELLQKIWKKELSNQREELLSYILQLNS